MSYPTLKDHVNAEYLGDDGLIVDLRPHAIGSEDNPHYFTSIYLELCRILGCPDEDLRRRYFKYVEDCTVSDFGNPIRGLFHRWPYNSNLNGGYWRTFHVGSIRISSQEELMAIAMFNSVLAGEILAYGKKNRYSWDNRCPNEWTFRGFLARFFEFVPYLKHRVGEKTGLVWQLFCAGVILASTRKEKGWTNGRLKMLVASWQMRNSKHRLIRWAFSKYLKHMTEMYGDVGSFFEIYFGKTHPFTVWMAGKPF